MRHRALVLIGVAAMFVACAPRGDDTASVGLVNTSWTVIAIGGAPTLDGAKPTLTFAGDGTVSGSAGCNQYSGAVRTDGAIMSVGEIASTLMGCDGDRGSQEAAFLGALRGATTWRLADDGKLVISGAGEIVAGPGVAEGPPGDQPWAALVGTRWVLAEMGGTSDLARLVLTLAFSTDGTVSGFAGCNTFSGPYTIDQSSLSLGPLASTKIGCPRPASAVEAQYLEALAGVAAWTGADGRLELEGPIPLAFEPG